MDEQRTSERASEYTGKRELEYGYMVDLKRGRDGDLGIAAHLRKWRERDKSGRSGRSGMRYGIHKSWIIRGAGFYRLIVTIRGYFCHRKLQE